MIIDSPIISGSYAASGSLNQIGNVTITGSLTVTGDITGTALTATSASYALTASHATNVPQTSSFADNATSASYAATASYISGSGAGVGFPYSGSAVITGSLLITELSGSGTKYVITDNNGLLSISSGSTAIKVTETITSTADQTSFTVPNGYTTGLVDVFINGIKLSDAEFTDNDGVTITLATGSNDGDIVEFAKYQPANGVTNNALRQLTQFTATAGQTVFSASYTPGLLDIYYNGSRLSTSDYTANNGTYFTLATASAADDILDVLVYSYQVGAFNGIGGTGVPTQIAYFNTTSSITGSNNFTISGSTMTVTGSLVVSGSGTFTNIGPAVMSGSLNVSGAITTNSTITATTLVVQTVTSSNSQISGSTKFGTLISDTHQFTGSVSVSGSATFGSNLAIVGQSLSAWGGTFGVLQSYYGSYFGGTSTGGTTMGNNNYYNGSSYVYINSDYATQYQQGSGEHFWRTATSGTAGNGFSFTERMRITNAGNVGIGTSSPSQLLHVAAATGTNAFARIEGGSGGYGGFLELMSNSVGSGTDSAGRVDFYMTLSNRIASIDAKRTAGGANYGTLIFSTADNSTTPTERMRITSGGNVGIGTSSPTSNLEIFDNTNSGVLSLSRDNGQQRGLIRWGRNNSGTFQSVAQIVGDSDTTSINNGVMTFWNSNSSGTMTERMRIAADGDVLIGRSSNYSSYPDAHVIEKDSGAYALMVRNSNTGNCSTTQFTLAGDPNNTSSYFLICRGGDTAAGANRLLIYGNGNVQNANGSYGTISSDRRLKENIIDATSKLEDIMKLRVVNFNLIDNEEKHIGFIAQEMQEVFPSFVYQTDTRQYDEDGNVVKGLEDALGLKVGMEFAVLVKALQEANAKITALEEKLERNNII